VIALDVINRLIVIDLFEKTCPKKEVLTEIADGNFFRPRKTV